MAKWIRFEHNGKTGFGTLEGDTIAVHDGELFGSPRATGQKVALAQVQVLIPAQPTKMVALWNNFHALAAKQKNPEPAEPLYFMKVPCSFTADGSTIKRPKSYDGKVAFEGELGVVIGKTINGASESEAKNAIFGYTVVNDIAAAELLYKDASFAQWTRAKNFDTFTAFGPVIATGVNPAGLTIKTLLDGQERQNYPVSDMFFGPEKLVHLICQDMTLLPGDIITCGTSIGSGSMKPGAKVEVHIEGVGVLRNTMG